MPAVARFAMLVTALFAAAPTVRAEEAEYRFAGTFSVDARPVRAFSFSLAPLRVRMVPLDDTRVMEVVTPRDDEVEPRTQVRVLERTGDDFRVVHEAVVVAPAFQVRSFALLICSGRVAYVTPAPATPPSCSR